MGDPPHDFVGYEPCATDEAQPTPKAFPSDRSLAMVGLRLKPLNTVLIPPTPPRGHRTTFLIVVWVLAIVAGLAIRLVPELERNFQALLRTLVLLIALALTLVWFLLLSRHNGLLRLVVAAALVVFGFLAPKFLKIDGTADGTGRPRIVWRSAPATRAAVTTAPSPSTIPPPDRNTAILRDAPQFLGARRDGTLTGAGLASSWETTPPRELWRHPVGSGWSAFAVSGNMAVTQEQNAGGELVTAYDPLAGTFLWAHTNYVRFFQWQAGEGPHGTPTIDSGRVYTYGGTGILDCLELADGRPVWSRDVLSENKLPNLLWGISCSPLVLEDSVIVTGGDTNGPTLLAFRRSDGEPLWRAGSDKASYASPSVATLVGRRVILSINAGSFTVHEPTNGAVLLDFRWSEGKWPLASQPVVLGPDRVFLSAGYGTGCAMLQIKAATDGRLEATELWHNKMMKTQFNSAAYRDGHLYGLDDGLLACVNAETGRRMWKDGRYGSGQTLLVDDLILVQTEPGPVVLAAARPDGFAELGRLGALEGKTWNNPTLAGRLLLVRNDHEAAAYELPAAGAATR